MTLTLVAAYIHILVSCARVCDRGGITTLSTLIEVNTVILQYSPSEKYARVRKTSFKGERGPNSYPSPTTTRRGGECSSPWH